jgi:hypothetical protein
MVFGVTGGQNMPAAQGIVVAIAIIVFGVLLFIDNIGIFPIRNLWQFWPLIFGVAGFQHMVRARLWSGRVWGGLLVALGVVWVCRNIGILPWGMGAVWALFIMGVGFVLLVKNVEEPGMRIFPTARGDAGENPATTDYSDADSYVKEMVIFSGTERRFDSRLFRGGELLAIFGGVNLDLRRAVPDTSQNMVLDAVALFGGIEVRIPENWRVVMRGTAVFGGYENKTIPPGPSAGAVVPTLVITGSVIFAGVSLKN